MSRGPYSVKLAATTRLIRATEAAGQQIRAVEHDPKTGFVRVLVQNDVAKPATAGAELDEPRREP